MIGQLPQIEKQLIRQYMHRCLQKGVPLEELQSTFTTANFIYKLNLDENLFNNVYAEAFSRQQEQLKQLLQERVQQLSFRTTETIIIRTRTTSSSTSQSARAQQA